MSLPDREAAARAIDAFLRALGRDPSAEPDLVGTGARVAEAFAVDLCAGYAVDTRALLGSSVIESPDGGGLVVVRDLAVTTTCPHHLMTAAGHATVAIMTRTKLVGLGTIGALVDAHARRLTLQERIGEAIVSDLESVLAPEWVACRLVLRHGCMVARGERATTSAVETVATRGAQGAALSAAHLAVGLGRT